MKNDYIKDLPKGDHLFFNAFQYAAIGMALVAPDGTWLMVNKTLCDLTGYSEEELLGGTFQDITHPDDLEEDLEYVRKMLAGDLETYQMEKRYFHKDGSIIYILLSVSLAKDETGSPLFFISQIQDITERKQLEKELVKQATEDMLTGINNRRRFYDLAERDIIRGGRYNEPMVLLMIDIDHFKKVNDTFGHAIGDKALKQMTSVCGSKLRSFDVFGRIGGEEFGVLLSKTDAVIGHQVSERLRRSVEKSVLITDRGILKFTISIGGVAFSGNQHTLDHRLKQADESLYKAKSTGRNQTVIIDTLSARKSKTESTQTGFVRLEWNSAYECGNKKIDGQHQTLFRLSNDLLASMIAQQPKEVCRQKMDNLIAEVSRHFQTEEELIIKAGYPHYEDHRKIHRELVNKALEMATRHEAGQIEIAEVFHFLAVQVVNQHMLNDDRQFFAYF